MDNLYFNLGIIFILILINGVFSMSEMSVVSSTKARLQKLVFERRLGAKAALRLHEEPTHFLSTVQVGITAVGILSGAFGEEALQIPIQKILLQTPALAPYSETLALIATVTLITYFSVVLGELVPKRLALQNPEGIASTIAKPMQALALIFSPIVWLLSISSRLLLIALRLDRTKDTAVTNEEIRLMMEMGSESGVFHADESQMVNNVMKLDDVRVRAIMVPRQDIYLIDSLEPLDQQRKKIEDSPYSQIIVCQGGFEKVLGVLNCRDLLKTVLVKFEFNIESVLKPPVYVQETMTITRLLKHFRETCSDLAIIVDEYGDIEGLVTITDLLTAIVGELPAISADSAFEIVERADGSWLVDGDMSIMQFRSEVGIKAEFPGEINNDFHTLAGMILFQLQKLPHAGESCLVEDWKFEVIDMDGTRIDKVLAIPLKSET
jgi:putative hemolysin